MHGGVFFTMTKEGRVHSMRCARCGRPAGPGDGTTCRYCGGPLVADDPMQGYGAPNPMQGYGAPNPHLPKPKKARGGGILRVLGSGVAILLTILIIAVVRVGLGSVIDHFSGTSTIDPAATAFSDPLTSNAYGWTDNAHAFFRSDGYHITQNFIEFAPVTPDVNVDVSVRVAQVSGDATASYGIAFRRASKGNFYAFEIDAQGEWDFIKVVNDQVTPIVDVTANAAIQPGLNKTNTLEVTTTGTHYVFLVNGTQVGEADDTTYGGRGIVGLEGSTGVEVVYSHLAMKWHP